MSSQLFLYAGNIFFLGMFTLGSFIANLRADDLQDKCSSGYFGMRIVDQATGRGVPLVRLRTTGGIELWTDSNGWIALDEPGLMGKEVYFSIDSPGYEATADGFGFRGVRVTPVAGESTEIPVDRKQLAERLYRITGQGIFADSQKLGKEFPAGVPALNGGVIGQDSVQMVPYRDKLFWIWGDTNLPNYPLGNFHVTAATSPLPESPGFDPATAIPLNYFVDSETNRVKKMLPVKEPGAVWLFGIINLIDEGGDHVLVAHYSRHLNLGNMVEHGIAVWNDSTELFEKRVTFELDNQWQIPRGQAVRHADSTGDFVYFAEPFVTTRVPASLSAMLDPNNYQAWTWDEEKESYGWQSAKPPATQATEQQWLKSGKMVKESAHFQIVDRETQKPVIMHRASVNYNRFRDRWILIGCEINPTGQPSHLGEIWYAEAPMITGPWRDAIKIATHPHYSFYNPRHHPCLDQEDGRTIYFEGTYTQMFSGNSASVPRYDYNQIMYRLDLSELP